MIRMFLEWRIERGLIKVSGLIRARELLIAANRGINNLTMANEIFSLHHDIKLLLDKLDAMGDKIDNQ